MNLLDDGSSSSECYRMYMKTLQHYDTSKKLKLNGKGAAEQLIAIGMNYDCTFNLEVYKDRTKTWEVEWASVSLGGPLILNYHVVYHQNEIYILCECMKDGYMRSFDKYKKRKELRPMNIWRRGYSAVSDGRYIFVVGGFNDVPALHCVER